jgi:geranylgeranyl pyrophosphate synthase
LKRCTAAEREAISALLKSAASASSAGADAIDLAPARAAVERYRGVADTVRRAAEHAERAAAAIAPFPDGRAKRELLEAADFAVARDR